MKKVIAWTVYGLILAGTALCFIFPVQAKEVCNNIMTVLNTPIAIAGVTVTLGGVLAFVISKFIMNNSKFGRKELDRIKEDFKECENEVSDHKEKIDNKIAKIENKYANLENNCENKVTIMLNQFEDLQNNVLSALEVIPNVKVKAIVADYKSQYAERKEEIITKTVNTNKYIDKKIAEMKAEFDKLMEKLKNEEANDDQATEE